MIRDAYAWLRDMASPPPLPEPPVRTPPIETPAPLRHTVPPVTGTATVRLTANESLDDLRAYRFGCVGLCVGGTCDRCDGLAARIGEARRLPDGQRGAREADLTQQINALREGQ